MYKEQTFDIKNLTGISDKQLEVHLKLYAGYVKNTNLLLDTVTHYQKTNDEGGKFAVAEMRRRFGFEFDGMRMHEYYFRQWEGGAQTIGDTGALGKVLAEQFGSLADFETLFKGIGMTRGIGWSVLYFDPMVRKFHTAWVGDHELGQLAGVPIILAMDMWEHAYMVDYTPAEKKTYIDAFWENLNWSVAEKRFSEIN